MPSLITRTHVIVVLLGPRYKLVRGQAPEAGMRSAGIVIAAPYFDDPARHWQAPKDVFVEALIPEAAVEAFDKGVLDRLSGGDVVPSTDCALSNSFDHEAGVCCGSGAAKLG